MHHACYLCVLSLPRRAFVNEYVDGSISSTEKKRYKVRMGVPMNLIAYVSKIQPFKLYPGEEAVLEMVIFDLKDLESSLKLVI